jgi:hypothetical protein
MAFSTISLSPGIFSDEASGDAESRYVASDMIRFHRGRPQILGGWQAATSDLVPGVARQIIQWADTDGREYAAIGTHKRVQILFGGELTDITPLESSGTLGSSPITTASGSTTITIADTSHGLEVDQEVLLASATAVGGLTAAQLNAYHTVLTTPDANTYSVVVSGAAASSTATGGGTPTYSYLIPPGFAESTGGTGWGAGTWNQSGTTFGTARTVAATTFNLRNWSFALYGEDLLMVASDHQTLYKFDTSAGVLSRGAAVSNAPACEQVLVNADTRQVLAFGGTDRMQIAFSEKNDITDWTSTQTNSAGSVSLGEGSEIIAVSKARGAGNFLVVTDQSAYLMTFIGGELVYRFSRVGGTPAPLGPSAIAEADGVVLYMADGAIMSYSGGTLQQLPCPILRTVFNELDMTNSRSTYAGINAEFGERMFFYRSSNSAADNDRVLIWHSAEGPTVWSRSTLDRSAWTDRGVGANPVAVDAAGAVYLHETGTSANGGNIAASITTADVDLPDSLLYSVTNFLPDFKIEGSDNLLLTFNSRISPLGEQTETGPHTITPTTSVVNVRATGRAIAFTVSSNSSNIFWRAGSQRVELQQSGASR